MKNLHTYLIALLLFFSHNAYSKRNPLSELKNAINLKYKSQPSTQGTVVAYAGSSCFHTTIQSAIDSGADEVRLLLETYNETITITNKSIRLIGGFANCTITTPSTFFKSTIDAQNNGTVITVNNDNVNAYEIIMKNLILKNGNSNIALVLGGGIEATGSLTSMRIEKLWSIDNTGSGINIEDLDSLSLQDVRLTNNTAIVGGGLTCSSTLITMYGRSYIANNNATKGGGIYAYNQCNVSFFSGPPDLNSGIGGIKYNQASEQGGAIYAYDGSVINFYGHELDLGNGTILGDASRPVQINNNLSVGNGGGIYLEGAGTQANLSGVEMRNNESEGNGGAISLTNQAQLVITRYNLPCWSNTQCNYLFRNFAGTTASNGGAIYAEANSVVALGNIYFSTNSATSGSAIWLKDNTVATIEGSVFYRNKPLESRAGQYVIGQEINSTLTLGFNTFVDNLSASSILVAYNSTLTNVGNLFYEYETGTVLHTLLSSINNYCLRSRDITGLLGMNVQAITFDPFVDRSINDYHLDAISGSIAFDSCNTSTYNPSLKDMDQQTRTFDAPITNIDGLLDVGADEYVIDEMFMNGFE